MYPTDIAERVFLTWGPGSPLVIACRRSLPILHIPLPRGVSGLLYQRLGKHVLGVTIGLDQEIEEFCVACLMGQIDLRDNMNAVIPARVGQTVSVVRRYADYLMERSGIGGR